MENGKKYFFSDKSSSSKKISQIEKTRVITGDSKTTEIFNNHFSNHTIDWNWHCAINGVIM